MISRWTPDADIDTCFGRVLVDLDLVGMTCAQLDAGVAQLVEPREDRWQVPVDRNLVR